MAEHVNDDVAVHFGLMPTHAGVLAELAGENGAGPYRPIYGYTGLSVAIDGSWVEWGEPDEGAGGIHVVLRPLMDVPFREQVSRVNALLSSDREPRTRVLDYAVITDVGDWSVDLGAVLLDTPALYVVPNGLIGDVRA